MLTEAFHMLGPASIGSNRLREFIEGGGLSVWFFVRTSLTRAFELMERWESIDRLRGLIMVVMAIDHVS